MMDMELLTEKGHRTLVDKENFSLTIEIPDFEMTESYRENSNGNISRVIDFNDRTSHSFVIGQSIDLTSSWRIKFRSGDKRSNDGVAYHAAVELQLSTIFHGPHDYVLCRFRINIVDKDGDLIYPKTWPSWNSTRQIYVGDSCRMADFIGKQDLLDNKGLFLSDNTLRLKLEGVLYGHFRVETIIISTQPVPSLKSISSQLWTSMEHWDIKLISKDEKFIKAHKLILSKASPVINAILMSLTDFEEDKGKEHGLQFLNDLMESDIRKILQYIYTGNVDQDWSDMKAVAQLISIADTYEIRGLKWLSFRNILNHLTLTNFTEVVELFYTFDAATVLQSILHQFFLKNQEKLIRSEAFQAFAKAKREAFLYVTLFHGS